MRSFSLTLLTITACSLASALSADDSVTSSALVANSTYFVVRSHRGGPSAAKALEQCQSLREELQTKWLGNAEADIWQPRCEIVIHATRASYLQVVGRGGGQTSGSSLIQFEAGRVAVRRIDLLVDQQGNITALPHELTHVVLADRFGGRQPPRWVDEGIATAADSHEKRTLHRRDCHDALRSGAALRMFELLTLEQFTSARQVPAFYGQSLLLVRFLATQGNHQKVIDFSEAAMDKGYDHALQQCYGIDGVVALEQRWRDFAMSTRQANM
jgi:hypothetical protein